MARPRRLRSVQPAPTPAAAATTPAAAAAPSPAAAPSAAPAGSAVPAQYTGSAGAFSGNQVPVSKAQVERSVYDQNQAFGDLSFPVLRSVNLTQGLPAATALGAGMNTGTIEPQQGTAEITAQDVMNEMENGDPTSIASYQYALYLAHYLGQGSFTPGTVNGATATAMVEMLRDANAFANTQQKPWLDYLYDQAQNTLHQEGFKGSVQDYINQQSDADAGLIKRSSTTSQTSVRTTITSAPDARAIFTKEMQSATGRAPTERELSAFTNALQSYQRANPAVTHATSTSQSLYDKLNPYVPKTTTTSEKDSTSDSSQINPEDIAYNYAHSGQLGNQANTFSVATDYYAAALNSLGLGGRGPGQAPQVTMAERPGPS